MQTEYETDAYQWVYDKLYGVGRVIRKVDNALADLETGSDCEAVRLNFARLAMRCASLKRPENAPSFPEVFDAICKEYFDDISFRSKTTFRRPANAMHL